MFKKDIGVIAVQAVLTLSLIGMLYLGKIDWPQLVVGFGLLQVPALFGRPSTSSDEVTK